MSAIGGILVFGGGPVDHEQLAALSARLDRLGPDGGHAVTAGAIGMTYRAFHTNAESRRDHQPYCRGHQTMLCWDGRLDNREKLLAELRDDLGGDDTDPAIAMAAYLRWRRDGIAKLVGDFALAIWDRRDRAVSLARDCVGTRSLYYHLDADRVIWSTDLDALLDVSGVPIEVNDEYVAGFFARGPEPALTPYVGVHAVKPAHIVRIDEDGLFSTQRFWALDPHKKIRYGSDAEYEEHFRAVFREAVRVRLRADRPVFSELSGGLDSSSVVCMADDVLEAREATAPGVETVTHLFDRSVSSDEGQWVAHVEAQRGAVGHRVLESSIEFLRPPAEGWWMAHPCSVLSSAGYTPKVRELMNAGGARILLSGLGGDELLHATNNPSPELMDLLATGRLLELHRRTLLWSRTIREPYIHVLWTRTMEPLLPPSLRFASNPPRCRTVPDCLAEKLLTRIDDAKPTEREPRASVLPSAAYQMASFESAVRWITDGYRQAEGGVETSFPFLHRPLVEFVQQIPFQQKIRPGQSRSILRRSLGGLLPPQTIGRRGKAMPSEATCRALGKQYQRLRTLFEDSRAAAHGYIDADKARRSLDRAVAGAEDRSALLVRVVILEIWLRAFEHRAVRGPSRVTARRSAGNLRTRDPKEHLAAAFPQS